MAHQFSSDVCRTNTCVGGLLLVCLLTFLPGAPARAAEDEVEALVQEGLNARKEHRNEDALAAFKKAWAKSPTPRIRAQIALAEQALGDWVAAERDLDAALAASDDPWIQKNRATLEHARTNIVDHLGWLVIEVSPAHATILVDAAPATAGTTRVRAGTVVVEVRAEGFVPVKRPVTVLVGLHAREKITLVPVSTPESVATTQKGPASTDAPPVRRVLGWSAVGLGAVGLGLGTYFGLSAWSLRKDRDAHCDSTGCDPDGLAADSRARTAATRADVAVVGGLVLATVGVVLIVTSPRAPTWTVGLGPGSISMGARW